MTEPRVAWAVATVLTVGLLIGGAPGTAAASDLEGLWYGYGHAEGLGKGTIEITFSETSFDPVATTTIPVLGVVDQDIPSTVEDSSGVPVVTIGIPGLFEMSGEVSGNVITGTLEVEYGGTFTGPFYLEKDTGESFHPGAGPGPVCDDLPALFCNGPPDHCGDVWAFWPETGLGYFNYPLNGETPEDQYRSFLRRDLIQIVKYAAAKVACKAADWGYGNRQPLGLGDMSEADGSIPGTSIGAPGHPPGTHEDGKDIDIAYYQLFAADNRLRAVGVHQPGPFQDAFHLIGEPYALDVWRTALFIATLFEHPRIRVVGVDGKIGPLLVDAFDELVSLGWIDFKLRRSIVLAFEVRDTGLGWFLFHHHHMHVSLYPVKDLEASEVLKTTTSVKPSIINR